MRAPNAVFIRGDDGRVLTYGEFWSLSGRIANLLAKYSVKAGDRVAVQVHKSIEALALFLACARLGAIFLPLNPAYTVAEVSYFIGDAEPSLVICDPAKAEALAQIADPILTLDDRGGGNLMEACEDQCSLFGDAAMDWDDAIAILYTSGTTGKSKGALLSHGNLASNAVTLVEAWRFTAKDVLIHALPVYHTHGLFTATNTMLLSGGGLLFRRKFDVDDVISLLPKATALMGVPTFYTRLLEHKALTRRRVSQISRMKIVGQNFGKWGHGDQSRMPGSPPTGQPALPTIGQLRFPMRGASACIPSKLTISFHKIMSSC